MVSMTQPASSGTKKKWYITVGIVVAALLAFFANVSGTIDFFQGMLGLDEADTSTPDSGDAPGTKSPGPSGSGEATSAPVTVTTTTERDAGTTEPPATGDGSAGDPPAPGNTEGWFDLTAYEPVAFGNGHYSVNSINIGTGVDPYPQSIRGSYSSSASDPNNQRTWLVSGKCTRLSVWVGKDAASPQAAGIGQFIVKSGDIQIHSVEATITDAPQHIDLDITGVSRLTLFDTRGGRDANNAWGSPKVYCTAPPGKSR